MKAKTISPHEFAERMAALADAGDSDPEKTHCEADDLMLATLRSLGYEAGCILYEDLDRWYA